MHPHTWMRQALNVAETALPHDVPVGCLIVKDDQIIAQAANRRERDHNPAGHAEILAMQQAAQVLGNWRLSGCILVVTLEPCPMCAAAIQQARIKQVIYGADDILLGACGSRLQLLGDIPVLGGVLAEDCQRPLKQFFEGRRSSTLLDCEFKESFD